MIKVKLLSHWGPGDNRVAEAAWASTYDQDKWENRTEEQRDKVLDIVVGHGHGTPLESVWLEFYIECPIFVERQLDKYRMTQQCQDIQINEPELSGKKLIEQYRRREQVFKKMYEGYNDPNCTCDDDSETGDNKLGYCSVHGTVTKSYSALVSRPATKDELKYSAAAYMRAMDEAAHQIEYPLSKANITSEFAPMGRDNITQNELSGRYRTIPNRFIEMSDDVAEIKAKISTHTRDQEKADWYAMMHDQYEMYEYQIDMLKQAVKEGNITQAEYKRAREFLRGILGTAFITHMKLVLNLRAFENILRERLAPDAQSEIREVAKLMLIETINNKIAPKVIEKMIERNSWKI